MEQGQIAPLSGKASNLPECRNGIKAHPKTECAQKRGHSVWFLRRHIFCQHDRTR
jgi:hypothetical protein